MCKTTNYFFYQFTIIIIFIFGSCSNDKSNDKVNNNFTTYNINVDHIADSCDRFIQNAKLIPLEFNDQIIVNGIDKLIPFKEKLIVFDKRLKQVFVFDSIGNSHSIINKYGKGDNEYLFPSDIIIDKNRNRIGILAQLKGYLIWFNLDGEFLSTNKIGREKIILSQAYVFDDKIYHFVHNTKTLKKSFQVNITDLDLKRIDFSLFKSNPNQISNVHMHPFGVYQDNITLHLPYDQSVYKIVSDEASKLLYFDFKDKNLPENLLEKILSVDNNATSEQVQNYNKEILNFVKVKEIILLKDFIFLEITYKYQRFCAVINLHDNNSGVFRNNLGKFYFGKYIGSNPDKNTIYFEVPPTQINKYKSSKITNMEIVEKKYNKNLLKNNPWILKIQL